MSQWRVETFARIRPLSSTSDDPLTISVADNETTGASLNIEIPHENASYTTSGTECTSSFEMSGIFGPETSQSQVFEHAVKDLLLKGFEGVNSCLFAYGQTGSGKTYTMFGGGSFESRGIIPRALSFVFSANRHSNKQCKIYVSFVQIFNESIFELLTDKRQPSHETSIFQVTTEEDALNLMFLGQSRRISKETDLNKESSRSHSIFSIHVESETTRQTNGCDVHIKKCGKIIFVDLAGSERFHPENDVYDYTLDSKKKSNRNSRQYEGRKINLSLHYLEQTIVFLTQHTHHVPYRNSVLTRMLADCLGGNCKTRFLLTINPSVKYYEDTCSTCRFAARCSQVTSTVQVNEEMDPRDEVLLLRKENEELRNAISSMTENHQRDLVSRDNSIMTMVVQNGIDLTQAQLNEVQQLDVLDEQSCNKLSKKSLILIATSLHRSLSQNRLESTNNLLETYQKELSEIHSTSKLTIYQKETEIAELRFQLSQSQTVCDGLAHQVTRFIDEPNNDDCPADLSTKDGFGSEQVWRMVTRGQTFLRISDNKRSSQASPRWGLVRQIKKYSSDKPTRNLCYVWCSQGLTILKMKEVALDDVMLEETKNDATEDTTTATAAVTETNLEFKNVESITEIDMGFRVVLKNGDCLSFFVNPALPAELRVAASKKWAAALGYVLRR